MINDEQTLKAISATDLIKANITNKNALKGVEHIPASMPILVIAGAADRVQQTKSLDEIIKRMGSEQKEFVVLPNKGHLLIEHRTVDPSIAQWIDEWLDRQTGITGRTTSIKAAVSTGLGQANDARADRDQ
jgi:alpha-beta hydrolase superfamily lysophospholipase